jgi:enediyne biosynthesis protein E4
MISSVVWADVDNDKLPDLIIAGEWMPIRVFKNGVSKFQEVTAEMGLLHSNGWWNCVKAVDINNDGLIDLVAGNTGDNSFFNPTEEEPVSIVAKDFDKNGSTDPLISYYNPVEQDRFMVHNRLVLIDQIPSIKGRFPDFNKFATTPFRKAFTKEEVDGALTLNAYTLSSVILLNENGKSFKPLPLPQIAQVSPINDLLIEDLNGDGHQDLILIGNSYEQETLFGRYDASLGTILLGTGNNKWEILEPRISHFLADGNAKTIKMISRRNHKLIMVANNGTAPVFYLLPKKVM